MKPLTVALLLLPLAACGVPQSERPQTIAEAKDRWTRPEYAARLVDIETRARAIGGWCKEAGK